MNAGHAFDVSTSQFAEFQATPYPVLQKGVKNQAQNNTQLTVAAQQVLTDPLCPPHQVKAESACMDYSFHMAVNQWNDQVSESCDGEYMFMEMLWKYSR